MHAFSTPGGIFYVICFSFSQYLEAMTLPVSYSTPELQLRRCRALSRCIPQLSCARGLLQRWPEQPRCPFMLPSQGGKRRWDSDTHHQLGSSVQGRTWHIFLYSNLSGNTLLWPDSSPVADSSHNIYIYILVLIITKFNAFCFLLPERRLFIAFCIIVQIQELQVYIQP